MDIWPLGSILWTLYRIKRKNFLVLFCTLSFGFAFWHCRIYLESCRLLRKKTVPRCPIFLKGYIIYLRLMEECVTSRFFSWSWLWWIFLSFIWIAIGSSLNYWKRKDYSFTYYRLSFASLSYFILMALFGMFSLVIISVKSPPSVPLFRPCLFWLSVQLTVLLWIIWRKKRLVKNRKMNV